MARFEMAIKTYPEEAKHLVEIWNHYAEANISSSGIEFVTFVHKRPKNPRNDNRRIAGLKAQCISYLKDDTELVKMSAENFIYLMAKCGVRFEAKEITEGGEKS